MKKVFWIIGAIIVGAGLAAGGFYAGMTYHENQVDDTRARFEAMRGPIESGQAPGGNFPAQGQAPGGVNIGRGGGVNGQVKSLNGDELQISTANDVTTVKLSEDTLIQMTAIVSASELAPGVRVMVVGEADAEGVIQASQVRILDEDLMGGMPPGMPYPAPTTSAP